VLVYYRNAVATYAGGIYVPIKRSIRKLSVLRSISYP
jgi:hypothetical protein